MELKDFKEMHGHCRVPVSWKHNPQLGKRVKNQRQQHKVYTDYSEGKGKGLYAAKKIKAGNMIGYYGGVIQERTEINDSIYLFSLGKSSGMEINAQYCGGMTRYINAPSEGEEANVVACVVGGERIKITAKKDLGVGDELLLDYGPEYFVDPPVGEEEED